MIFQDRDGDYWQETPEGLVNVNDLDGRYPGPPHSRENVEGRWGPLRPVAVAPEPDLFDDATPHSRPKQRAFPARCWSECGDCWGNIWPGDMIVGSDNGYVHEECALKEGE